MFGNKKFYKLSGLNNIFRHYSVDDKEVYNTNVDGFVSEVELRQYGVTGIDEHTILFITACPSDEGRYVNIISKELINIDGDYLDEVNETMHRIVLHKGDTMIWARGNLYSISSINHVNSVTLDKNNNIVIENSDGTMNVISPVDSKLGYTGIYPIVVEDSKIALKGITIDEKNNVIVNPDSNSVFYGVNNANVSGIGNTAIANSQTIIGKYALSDYDSIFIIGNGTKETPFNLFSVGFDGVVQVQKDVIAQPELEVPFRLTDIHSVLDVDWAFINTSVKWDSFDESFDASFNDNVNDNLPSDGPSFNDDFNESYDKED